MLVFWNSLSIFDQQFLSDVFGQVKATLEFLGVNKKDSTGSKQRSSQKNNKREVLNSIQSVPGVMEIAEAREGMQELDQEVSEELIRTLKKVNRKSIAEDIEDDSSDLENSLMQLYSIRKKISGLARKFYLVLDKINEQTE